MAVFTELSDEDRDSITEAYGVTPLLSVIGIADGDRETTYLFRSKDSEYIVTLFENGASAVDLERAFQTMEWLYDQGIPCPKPLRTEAGKATLDLAGRLIAVVSFVSGLSTSDPTPARCRSLGRLMAQIHALLQSPGDQRRGELPTGAVHGALLKPNVFFLGDAIAGVINFRLRHYDALVAEVADALSEWACDPDGSLSSERVRAILDGYQSVRTLQPNETAALPGFFMASTARRLANNQFLSALPGSGLAAYEALAKELLAIADKGGVT